MVIVYDMALEIALLLLCVKQLKTWSLCPPSAGILAPQRVQHKSTCSMHLRLTLPLKGSASISALTQPGEREGAHSVLNVIWYLRLEIRC